MIEPADLQRLFLKTFLECIVIPTSNWLKRLEPGKTAEEQEALLRQDSELFIEFGVFCSCVFVLPDTVGRFLQKRAPSGRLGYVI